MQKLKKRFFIYQSRENVRRENRVGFYQPTCEIRDRATLVPNPEAPAFKMFAIVATGLTYWEAWKMRQQLNLANQVFTILPLTRD